MGERGKGEGQGYTQGEAIRNDGTAMKGWVINQGSWMCSERREKERRILELGLGKGKIR